MKTLDEIDDAEYSRFYESMKFCMKWEGGYVNDKDDPGGETKWGISKKSYPNEDIKNLTPERAATLYLNDYWIASGANGLETPLCTVVLDTAIHCGVSRAVRWFKGSGGDIKKYLTLRRIHYVDLCKTNGKLQKYLNGWFNRLNDLEKLVEMKTAP